MAYQFEHSVEVGVGRETAWRFWTNVENWVLDADIEWVTLDDPFRAGARGTTKTRGLIGGSHWLALVAWRPLRERILDKV